MWTGSLIPRTIFLWRNLSLHISSWRVLIDLWVIPNRRITRQRRKAEFDCWTQFFLTLQKFSLLHLWAAQRLIHVFAFAFFILNRTLTEEKRSIFQGLIVGFGQALTDIANIFSHFDGLDERRLLHKIKSSFHIIFPNAGVH